MLMDYMHGYCVGGYDDDDDGGDDDGDGDGDDDGDDSGCGGGGGGDLRACGCVVAGQGRWPVPDTDAVAQGGGARGWETDASILLQLVEGRLLLLTEGRLLLLTESRLLLLCRQG